MDVNLPYVSLVFPVDKYDDRLLRCFSSFLTYFKYRKIGNWIVVGNLNDKEEYIIKEYSHKYGIRNLHVIKTGCNKSYEELSKIGISSGFINNQICYVADFKTEFIKEFNPGLLINILNLNENIRSIRLTGNNYKKIGDCGYKILNLTDRFSYDGNYLIKNCNGKDLIVNFNVDEIKSVDLKPIKSENKPVEKEEPKKPVIEQIPYVTVVMTTHNRTNVACAVIDSLCKNLKYPKLKWCISDDRSDEGHVDKLVEQFKKNGINEVHVEKTNKERYGLGASLNNGLIYAWTNSDIVLTTEDDWILEKELKLAHYVDIVNKSTDIAGIRLATMNYAIANKRSGHKSFYIVESDGKNKTSVFNNQVMLRHKRTYDKIGYYKENCSGDISEIDEIKKFNNQKGLAVLYPDFIKQNCMDDSSMYFIHIGKSVSGHERYCVPERYKWIYDDNHKLIVVTFTSWTKRINNCVEVISSVLSNTLIPDRIYLNLSKTEFPEGEKQLPKRLINLVKKNKNVIINWVDGENTKTMKKVFPILNYLDDDDIIIYIDDDMILPKDFVQSRINDFKQYGCNHPITSNRPNSKYSFLIFTDMTGIKIKCKSSSCTLITKRMLYGYDSFYKNKDVYTRSADDSLYTILVLLNGYTFKSASNYITSNYHNTRIKKLIPFNEEYPLHSSGVYKKQGYSTQNTYITLSLYFSLLRQIPNIWNSKLYYDMIRYKKIKKYHNIDYYLQVKSFNTVKNMDNKQGKITYWYWKSNQHPNAGDDYNKYLINHLYNCKCERKEQGSFDLCLCGSTIQSTKIHNAKYIVGCGIQRISNIPPPLDQSKYLAVRGKITKRILQDNYNIKLNDNIVFCDPGLLLSYIYPVQAQNKRYKIGIIPHYIDEDNIRKKYGESYHVISMKTDDIERLANDINSCEIIISSSLHGIIFSHSYGIPAYHTQFTDLQHNGNWKFLDYYTSLDLNYKKFMYDDFEINFDEIYNYHKLYDNISNPTKDRIDVQVRQYIECLPFKEYLKPSIIDICK